MMVTAETYHVPVLLQESVDGLDIQPDGVYVDVTFGGGGHSREILSRLGPKGHQDADAEKNIVGDDRFTFVRSNFRYIKNWMRYYGVEQIDGLLGDLGVSSHHFDDETRGFSFRFDAPLDMRMNKRAGLTAADILNDYSEERLADVFYLYGELKNARRLAKTIVDCRKGKRIETTADLSETVEPLMRSEREKKDLARVYQALRIEVNHEMDALRDMLCGATSLLREGGRLSIITYHSLEDRIVKNVMKAGNAEGRVEQDFFGRITSPFRLVNKVTTPTDDEQQRNPRSRSAKLRIAESTEGKLQETIKKIKETAVEEDPRPSQQVNLRTILGGDLLTTELVRSQIWLFVLIVAFSLVYVAFRYQCQQDMIKIDQLENQLKDAKFKALSSSSSLTEKCRESHVLEILKQNQDSLLHQADQPPYIIEVGGE